MSAGAPRSGGRRRARRRGGDRRSGAASAGCRPLRAGAFLSCSCPRPALYGLVGDRRVRVQAISSSRARTTPRSGRSTHGPRPRARDEPRPAPDRRPRRGAAAVPDREATPHVSIEPARHGPGPASTSGSRSSSGQTGGRRFLVDGHGRPLRAGPMRAPPTRSPGLPVIARSRATSADRAVRRRDASTRSTSTPRPGSGRSCRPTSAAPRRR